MTPCSIKEKKNMDIMEIYCKGTMTATAELISHPSGKIIDKSNQIKKNQNWKSDIMPIIKDVISERFPKYLEEMKPVVEDPMMASGMELLLRENLNAECILAGIEVINKMEA